MLAPVVSLLILLAASLLPTRADAAGPGLPPAPPQVIALKSEGGLRMAGGLLAAALKDRPSMPTQGRIAVGWGPAAEWLAPLGRGLADAWPACVLLSDLGAAGRTPDEAYAQVDPASFSALLWLEPVTAEDKSTPALELLLRPAKDKPPSRIRVDFTPPLRGPAPGAVPEFKVWATLDGTAKALAWEEGDGDLWAATEANITVFAPSTHEPLHRWPLPPARADAAPGPAVLAFLPADARPSRIGWFDLGRSMGRWYEKGPDGFHPAGELTTLPMPDRILKFITPEFESSAAGFLLRSYQGKELGRCLSLARFQGPDGTCFAFLTPDGLPRVIRGDSLAVLDGPSSKAAALATWGRLLLLASSSPPFTVKAFVLGAGYTWEAEWTSPLLPSAPVALAAGGPPQTPDLFAATGSEILSAPFPKTHP